MEITVRERRASYSSLKEQRKMFQGGGRKNLGEKKRHFRGAGGTGGVLLAV